jgi:hypothetical protein
MIYPCYFCQIPLQETYFSLPTSREFRCHTCPLPVEMKLVMRGGKIVGYSTNFYYQDSYRFVFILQDELDDMPKFLLVGYLKIILELDYLPNITPYNVEKKLPTLLTFL